MSIDSGFQCKVALGLPRENDANDLGVNFTYPAEQMDSVHAGHANIRDDNVESLGLHGGKCPRATVHKGHLPVLAQGIKKPPEAVQHLRLVIDKENASHHWVFSSWFKGRRILKVVPDPTSVSKKMMPPCFLV